MERNEQNSQASSRRNRHANNRRDLELLFEVMNGSHASTRTSSRSPLPLEELSPSEDIPFCTDFRPFGSSDTAGINTTRYNTPRAATIITEDGSIFVVGEKITIEHIRTVKTLLKEAPSKSKELAELKTLLEERDKENQELRRKLEMYSSNVDPLCSSDGSFTKDRPQGDF